MTPERRGLATSFVVVPTLIPIERSSSSGMTGVGQAYTLVAASVDGQGIAPDYTPLSFGSGSAALGVPAVVDISFRACPNSLT